MNIKNFKFNAIIVNKIIIIPQHHSLQHHSLQHHTISYFTDIGKKSSGDNSYKMIKINSHSTDVKFYHTSFDSMKPMAASAVDTLTNINDNPTKDNSLKYYITSFLKKDVKEARANLVKKIRDDGEKAIETITKMLSEDPKASPPFGWQGPQGKELIECALEATGIEVIYKNFKKAGAMYSVFLEKNINDQFNDEDWWSALDALVGSGCDGCEVHMKQVINHLAIQHKDRCLDVMSHIEHYSTKIDLKNHQKKSILDAAIETTRSAYHINKCPPKAVADAIIFRNNDFLVALQSKYMLPTYQEIKTYTDIEYHNQLSDGKYQELINKYYPDAYPLL